MALHNRPNITAAMQTRAILKRNLGVVKHLGMVGLNFGNPGHAKKVPAMADVFQKYPDKHHSNVYQPLHNLPAHCSHSATTS